LSAHSLHRLVAAIVVGAVATSVVTTGPSHAAPDAGSSSSAETERRAKIAILEPDHFALQRALLEKEGVRFDAQVCIVLREFGWLPT